MKKEKKSRFEVISQAIDQPLSRKDFFKTSALLGSAAMFSSMCNTDQTPEALNYHLQNPESQIYTTCLQCHNACSIKAKIDHGLIAKIEGNPYGPQTMLPHINYENSPLDAAAYDGKSCLKAQSAIQTTYDPYRIRKVLKRAGKRGENRWVSIDFNTAIEEIVNGGDLFKEGDVKGLKDVFVLRDAKLAKRMAEDAKNTGKGKMSLAAFHRKYKNNLDVLTDSNHPDLGPKNNGFVMLCGRIEHGRKELGKRFTHNSFGSKNFFEHTTICEQSHHIGYNEISRTWEVKNKKGQWGKGKTHHLKPDLLHSEFVIFFGTGAFEANFGKTAMAQKVTDALVERNFKMAVVDPRLSKTAAKAKWWFPVKPGTDAAFAYGMMRWMFENERYDQNFLANANMAAAQKNREKSITDAPLLVKIEQGRPAAYLRASEIGIGGANDFVVLKKGKPARVDINSQATPVVGDLFVNQTIQGIKVKSALQLVKDEAMRNTVSQWAQIAGVDEKQLMEVAKEFTSHGKKAAVEFYRGAVQHTNGYYNALAMIYLNMLIGNIDWLGGLQKGGGHWHEFGDKQGPYNLKKSLHPGKLTSFGPAISRESSKYEDFLFFKENNYPAKRQWYPYSKDIYHEVIPSIEDEYPYKVDALFLHKGTPILATPAGHRQIKTFIDTKKIPLLIACDIVIGETSMYADYIIPDLTFLERWGTPHISPDVPQKISKIRQPVIAPIPETVNLDGEEMPISFEAFLIAIGKKLGLSGFGENGFAKELPFHRPEDWYIKLVANLAQGDKKNEQVPEASPEEIKLFQKAREHLPRSVFDEEKWKKAIGSDDSMWRRIIYILGRGARVADYDSAFKKAPYTGRNLSAHMKFFVDHVAQGKNAISGKHYSGIGIYEEIKNFDGSRTDFETLQKDEFYLSTYKETFGGQSRTVGNYWAQTSLGPENFLLMNLKSAQEADLQDGDEVILVSGSNKLGEIDLMNGQKIKVTGKIKTIQGIRPGVVTASWHFGHWAYGAGSVLVDGETIEGDPRRATGFCPNPVMDTDKTIKNMSLTCPIGASSSFYNTKVKLVKV